MAYERLLVIFVSSRTGEAVDDEPVLEALDEAVASDVTADETVPESSDDADVTADEPVPEAADEEDVTAAEPVVDDGP
ncbi:hypothetical protein OXX80_013416, partial [Metschnikowia pulcherrima]